MRRVATAAAVMLVVSACAGGPGATTSIETTTTEPSTTTTATTTAPPVTTTTVNSAVAIHALDRSGEATGARMQADLDALVSNGPRVSGTESEAAALEWFAATAGAITGVVAAVQPVPLPNGTASSNVWVGPIGTGDRVILLGSHVDSVATSPGVDDNGSGLVVLLELLRRLAEVPPDGVRVVVVAFGAEELVPGFGHHYGSDLAAAEMAAAGTLPDVMVSVDMVGVGDVLHSTPLSGSDRSLANDLIRVAADIGVTLEFQPRGDISDHVPFARRGVPSALLFRGDNPGYHTPADDHVEMEGVLEALAVIEALIASFA